MSTEPKQTPQQAADAMLSHYHVDDDPAEAFRAAFADLLSFKTKQKPAGW